MSQEIVIGIHGLKNKPPRNVLEGWWLDALTEGLRRNAGATPRLAFALAYWADVLHHDPVTDAEQTEPYVPAPGDGPLDRYDPDFLDRQRAILDKFGGRAIDMGKELTDFGERSEGLLGISLTDLAAYYHDESVRQVMRGRLTNLLETHKRRPIVLIAHSMGSIIAYDALRQADLGGTLKVEHLITIGSPLGLPLVGRKIRKEFGDRVTPACVHRWTNLADPRDRVALDANLKDEYGPSVEGVQVRDVLVSNGYTRPDGEENHHKSYGYLRAPELTDLVREFTKA